MTEKLDGKQDPVGNLTPVHAGNFAYGKRNHAFNTASKTARVSDAKKLSVADELKSSEELINFLENKLEQHEKNLVQKKVEYEAL